MIKIMLLIYIMSAIIQTATGMSVPHGQSITTVRSWSSVDIVYYRYFAYTGGNHDLPIAGCHSVPWKKKNRYKASSNLLSCTEHVKLLMPTAIANIWQEEQKQLGYIDLHAKKIMSGHYNPDMQAHIILMKSVKLNPESFTHSKNKHPVTALFIRHARNVGTYRFKNIKTGIISTVNATANHPFYVKNKKKFIPISNITASDTLLTETGQPAQLVCQKRNKKNCGTLYKKDKITTVYNMETYPYHTYFVGRNHPVLVHNCSVITTVPTPAPTPEPAANQSVMNRVINKKPENILSSKLPDNMLVHLIEQPPAERLTERGLPLSQIKKLSPDKVTNKILSPFTGNEVVGIKDNYGNEIIIRYLQIIEQHKNGEFIALDPAKIARVEEIHREINLYSEKIRRMSSPYKGYDNDPFMYNVAMNRRRDSIETYQKEIARRLKKLRRLGREYNP